MKGEDDESVASDPDLDVRPSSATHPQCDFRRVTSSLDLGFLVYKSGDIAVLRPSEDSLRQCTSKSPARCLAYSERLAQAICMIPDLSIKPGT